ncbi:L,D-transpeptidase family protein [Chitinophaga sancti]|uniref:L,D-transpeptidase family protein n=1 Tax=Chitinophaga sancti TaxID=1004 RepID=A0A1K1SLM1_9BACT|nr:L,D-transpeptidase family protein [Chitinophaga sancti]WQD63871.1 L,D-transpeptidase family protein [Chitinophaga sancti]WQG90504.1 L,D-transpeptidase family protein [Chitinophaga sancti]SFW85233.1 Murein L,D-transpeptidase YcbB/YkuD [Chitinophaga sancti]
MKYWLAIWVLLLCLLPPAQGQSIPWLSDSANRQILCDEFARASLYGLDEHDYAYKTIIAIHANVGRIDSAAIERELTNAAIAFYADIAYGSVENRVSYDGISYQPRSTHVRDSIVAAIAEGRLADLAGRLEPHNQVYAEFKKRLALLERHKNRLVPPISSNLLDSTNRPLLERFYQLGFTDTLDYAADEDTLRNTLRIAQRTFEMMEDGKLRPGVLEELNIPVEKRLYELRHALNTWRWLNSIQQEQKVIVVDIPAANLFYLHKDSVLFYTRCIVGKANTPTTPLISQVHEVILFPYWNVPHDIAVRELLPAIKDAPLDYLEYGNYQVLDKTGKVLDPATIKWQQLNKGNFPYRLRQLFGCDNSLGIIKLNFFSPYSTYLHDTPNKSYFLFNGRYFSHGCIRVENVDSLAAMLEPGLHPFLENAPARVCELASDKGQLIFPLKQKVPLFILYEVAWPDNKSEIRFYDDVYNKVK